MSADSPEILERVLDQALQLTGELLDALRRERQALVARTLPELEHITTEKARLCQELDSVLARLGPPPLGERIAALPHPWRERLEAGHRRLGELAAQTQKCNAVNGRIVHRSQQSVRELMHLMSGTDTDPLYSAQGYRAQGNSLSRTPGTAIAKA